ncbi:MAG: RNA polymerase sigma factor SigI [Bacillota bacterium]|nr:RNA polymerase sigma factor SigI [Bacillota bacterium]
MCPLSINERVNTIKNNETEINCLVEEYRQFIASCVQKVTGRYVRYGEDDELSIGLMAFVESVNSYDLEKGNFLSFSQNVIKRRLIDYYRKERKHSNVISINEYLNEEDEEQDLTEGKSLERYSDEELAEYRRLELAELKEELAGWDISFFDLAEASPKHKKTRKEYNEIISFLLSKPNLVNIIKSKKYLPVAEIEKELKIPRKTIERARKYIIAVILILTGDYQYIRNFVDAWGGLK